MSAKNKARKSTGPRALLASPQSNSTNRTLRLRGAAQVSSSTAQGDSSDSDVPTQRLITRNQKSTVQSTPGSSGLSSRASTSIAAAADSDDDEQSTLRLSSDKNQNTRKRIQYSDTRSDTTSDSDEAPGRIKDTREKKKPVTKKRIVRRKNSSSDSEEDIQPSVTSSTTSQTSKSMSSLNNRTTSSVLSPDRTTLQPRSMSSLVNKCVYYLLIADQKKCSIKKADIKKHIQLTGPEHKLYSEVMKEAGAILKKTYGLEIITSEKRKGEYMLINILSHDLGIHEFIDYSSSELEKRGFIFYVLTTIFMNEQSITDDELANALKPMGIDMNAKQPHRVFGDVHKYLSVDLVKQNYLERKCINKDPPQFEFTWGERAYQEADKKDLLEFASQYLGDSKPEDWILQYNDATSRMQESA